MTLSVDLRYSVASKPCQLAICKRSPHALAARKCFCAANVPSASLVKQRVMTVADGADGLARGQQLGLVMAKPPQKVQEKPLLMVVLGWYGAQMRHVSKYSGLLNASGYATVTGICPPAAVFSPTVAAARRFAAGLLDFVLAASSSSSATPIAFYVFSNGGCFPLEQVDWLLQYDRRYQGLRQRVQGVAFDSAPCYMHPWVGARAMGEGRPLLVRLLATVAFCMLAFLMAILSPGRPQKYWHNMTHLSLGKKALYLYSADDPLCDAEKVDQLVAQRRKLGRAVQAHRWPESNHVGHLRCHPKEYQQLLLGFLDSLCQ